MTEHNNPVGPTTNKDTLRAELANALHEDWCGCDSWDGVNCEGYYEGEFPESADAALAVVVPVLERQAAELDAALGGEARARQECNELYEEVSLLKRELANAQQAYNRAFDRMAMIENEEQGR